MTNSPLLPLPLKGSLEAKKVEHKIKRQRSWVPLHSNETTICLFNCFYFYFFNI